MVMIFALVSKTLILRFANMMHFLLKNPKNLVFKCGNSGEWIVLTNTKNIISTGIPRRLRTLISDTYNQHNSNVDSMR